MLFKKTKRLLAAIGLSCFAFSANAAIVTFDFSSFTEGSSVSFSSDGLGLTINNFLSDDDSPAIARNALGGLAFSDFASPYQADFTFSKDVKLISYSVSNAESDGGGAFFHFFQGPSQSFNNSVDLVGSLFPFTNTTDWFEGGQAIRFLTGDKLTAGEGGPGEVEAFALNSITVETIAVVSVVPLPAALPLYAAGILILGAVGWRRKRRN